jgi:two-component system sensor histidine kinase UhpB
MIEFSALAFQALVTALFALVYHGLWRQRRREHFATWGVAWGVYALRLVCISAFLLTRREGWLVLHQTLTVLVALLLLFAALEFSRGVRWRPRYLLLAIPASAWGWISIGVVHDMRVAGIVSVALLSGVTFWTAWVFLQHGRRRRSGAALGLAGTFLVWGLHHLDYPLLRSLGAGVLFGVFADVLLIGAVSVQTLFLVLGEERRALAARGAQLEDMTHRLLRAQEDERRRIARELHDEAGQALTAIKIELDLENRAGPAERVGQVLAQIRDLSNLLRPSALDDLGLLPALRGLVEDFSRRTRIEARLEAREPLPLLATERQVVIYRVAQEALTNVARHSGAGVVHVRLGDRAGGVQMTVEDDGRGFPGEPRANLGLLGMRERVAAAGGTLSTSGEPGRGFRVIVDLPSEGAG